MKAQRVIHNGFRDSVELSHESLKVVINADKGMVPELCSKKDDSWYNAHWQPIFRANSGIAWDETLHAPFWKVPLLYDIAGNFPCCPNFGPDHTFGSYELPPHGHTSLLTWDLLGSAADEQQAGASWSLQSPDHPFSYKKHDLICKGEHSHYTSLTITNRGNTTEPYNCGWHNTIGAPFLESGCIISNNARRFAVPEVGTEFDTTGRLAFGSETDTMKRVETRTGEYVDLSVVPGRNGYTDFLVGAVPEDCSLGWSTVVNPRKRLMYLTYFTGPNAVKEGEMPLYFYNYWMNYGGRPFQPWAAYEGGTDNSFCLGTENSVSRFANGLKDSVENPTLLGHPTHLDLAPQSSITLNYATAFLPYEGALFDDGVKHIEAEDEDTLIIHNHHGAHMRVQSQAGFKALREV